MKIEGDRGHHISSHDTYHLTIGPCHCLLSPFIFLYLLLTPIAAHAGNILTERYNLTSLDLSNGLPHNHISDIFMDSKAAGLVLFRYGLGTFPDVNDLP